MDQLPFSVDTIEAFFLMFVRVSLILALMPIFSSSAIPPQIKVGLSLILTMVLIAAVPHAAASLAAPSGAPLAMLVLLVIKEALVGLAMGFAGSFLFAGVQFAARLLDTEIGFGMVDLIDPLSDAPVSVMGQLWVIVFTVFLLLINGHYFFLLAIEKSFEVVPLGAVHFHAGSIAAHFTDMAGAVFVLAIKMSAPIYVALLLTEMALGVVARTVPQINIFFVGIPMKMIVGMGAAIVAFPMLAALFRKVYEGLITDIWSILYLMA